MSPQPLTFYGASYTMVMDPNDVRVLQVIRHGWQPERVGITAYGWAVESAILEQSGMRLAARWLFVRLVRPDQPQRLACEQILLVTETGDLYWLAQRVEVDGYLDTWQAMAGGLPWPKDGFEVKLHLRIGGSFAYHPN